jgi:uncharacterized membrane protein YgcG
MSKIDVSIWGIRAGFEDSGIFHSHNFADVKELQKDIYRGLADLSRPRNAYLVNRTSSHTVVTILHTDSFEYVAAGNPRSGYVAISLIFDKNKALSASPRTYLQQFVQWYKSVQGNNRANNFTAEQIQGIISQLTLVDSSLTEIPGRKAVPFNEEIELDAYLTGGNKYVRFTETLFFDASVPFEATGLKNDVIKMTLIIKDVEDSEERQRQIALEAEQKRQVIAAKEQELAALKNAGQVDQLIQAFDAFTYNQLLRSEIRSFVDAEKLKRAKEAEARDDERIAKEIRILIQGGNVDVASAKLSQLRDHNRLTDDERRKIQKFRDDERKKKDEEQTARAEAERKEKRKRTILTYSLVAVVVLLLATVTTSIILKYPASMYKADVQKDGKKKNDKSKKHDDQENQVDSDGDGVEDKLDNCPEEKGTMENNGCVKEETAPTPEPVDNFDINKKVEITYNGNIYIIKQGFTSENGMLWKDVKWRYFGGKWKKQEVNDASGEWNNITQADIDFILKKHAKKKPKTASGGNGGNGGNSGRGSSTGSGGTSGGGGTTSGGSNSGEKASIPLTNKNLLKGKHDEIKKDGEVSAAEQKAWSTLYKEKYTNGNYKKDDEIESWNEDID